MEKDLEYLYRAFVIEDYKSKNSYSFLSELSVITIKSLRPSMTEVGLRIDYRRFQEELKLWLYYRTGYNQSLFQPDQPDYLSYFGHKDQAALARIIPLVVANKNLDLARDEILKNLLFTSGHMEGLFENLLIGIFFYQVFNENQDIVTSLKQEVINFSQEDFLKTYGAYYRLRPRNEKKFKIQIEMERIKLINYFNQVEITGYEGLRDLLSYYKGETQAKSFYSRILKSFWDREYLNIEAFYLSLSSYLVKLRTSKIDPESLIIKDYVLPDIFSFKQGEYFFHSLLGQCQLVEINGNSRLVKTKSGYYNLKK